MRILLVLLVVLLIVPSGEAVSGRVSISSSLVSARIRDQHQLNTYLLWNRNVRTTPIGHAFLSCHRINSLSARVVQCNGTYVLPLGKIAVSGPIHRYRRFTLVVTGGTGIYLDSDGFLFSRRAGPGTSALIFNLS